ncbi:InlB B-repeat-containing protein [Candidatus Saccharibacteria bacterium]|nr:InlB B-repeat-containing protein [Candidatus Saccharibacteria bacterium]
MNNTFRELITRTLSHFGHKYSLLPIIALCAIFGSILSTTPTHATAKASVISLGVNVHDLSIDLIPSPNGSFGKSNDATISVSTDNFTGYTLTVSAADNSGLINEDDDIINPLTTAISENTFINDITYNNKWGYKPSQYISSGSVISNSNFLPPPTTSGDTIDITNAANSTSNTYTIAFGTKVNFEQPSGIYEYTYVITAVGNDITYNITYNTNTTDTVTNMPSPNPQIAEIAGGTATADSYTTLSSNVPIRTDRVFGGWCDEATTTDPTTGNQICSGTTYNASDQYGIDQTVDGSNIQLYAIWLVDPFPTVWSQMGACEFHGKTGGNITGTECSKYTNNQFIDTEIPLYSSANYLKDFEIHFTIDSYDPSNQQSGETQQTFVNDKLSSTAADGKAPGFVLRRNGRDIEFNSKMNDTQIKPTVSTSGLTDVNLYRINNVLYYSTNNGPLIMLQDITGFSQQFDLNTWFGGYPSDNCTGSPDPCTNAKRFIEATFSNMYIKLGDYPDESLHHVTFNANGGTPASTNYLIADGNALSTLPTVTYTNRLFDGWFTAASGGTQISAATVPSGNDTYYAHWTKSVALAQLESDNITVARNDTATINVTNSADLEPYTFSSNNTSIATVNSSTGVITGVSAGTATITMTGTRSHSTKTITVNVTGNTVTLSFNAQGGESVADIQVGQGASLPINDIPYTTKQGYILDGWYTGANGTGTKLTSSTVISSTTTYFANWTQDSFVCKAASTLHTETCSRSSQGCRAAGYTTSGDSSIITYGNLISSTTMAYGDAYNCDVNNDGSYDETTERFYLISYNDNTASLIHYRSTSNADFQYDPAIAELPTTSTWTNPNLNIIDGTRVSRFMTRAELQEVCNDSNTLPSGLGADGKCTFLMEQSNFSTTARRDGIWLAMEGTTKYRIQTQSRAVTSNTTANTPRAVIEISLPYLQRGTDPVADYIIHFNPHGGSQPSDMSVTPGTQLGSLPATTYTNHLFQGWFTAETGGTQISTSTTPEASTTYHAQWKKTVALAEISNNDFTLPIGGHLAIGVTNATELEPYTFSSDDTSIATVNSSTGEITGVSEGTTDIIMTGTTSGATKTLEVNVTADSTFTVTFDTQGGSSIGQNPWEVTANTAIGSLPTTTKTDYRFFGWYTDTTYETEVTPATIVSDNTIYYARWIEDTTNFPIVFAETNACTFNGTSVISGDYCAADKTKTYIDTAVQLFSTTNYNKDFEIGFNIVSYDAGDNIAQATLVNSKEENQAQNYPGFVMRKVDATFDLTARFSNGTPSSTVAAAGLKQVRITRRNGVMYYSWNGGSETQYFDTTGNSKRFNTAVWFGAAPQSDGTTPQRQLNGTLTDMYIRLGANNEYSITFDANGGYVEGTNTITRMINQGGPVGSLPTTTRGGNWTFDGWFTDASGGTQISASTTPSGDTTYYAHWTHTSSSTPVSFNVSNNATRGYETIIDSWRQSPVNITTFNKNTTDLTLSTWGDTTELSEASFWSTLRNNFETNTCKRPSYGDSYYDSTVNPGPWTSGATDCSQPDAYDTGVNDLVNVYLYNTSTSTLGSQVNYAKASRGVIHNLIPGQTYYWEKDGDNTIYGYISAIESHGIRWLNTGQVRNTRDLGGLPVDTNNDGTNDGTLVYGRLVRGERIWSNSANVTELTNIGLNKEYDLSEGTELGGDARLSQYKQDTIIHYNFDYGSANYTAAWNAVTDIMTDIADNNKNIYFHCRVGADRTGTIAYILEGLLGVPDEERYQEYELTHLSGLTDRTRYYKKKNTNTTKFVFMMDYLSTKQNVYNWYMQNPSADATLIQRFRTAMIE